MNLSEQALSWLQDVLLERYGHTFKFKYSDTNLILTLDGSVNGKILFPLTYNHFFSNNSDIPFFPGIVQLKGGNYPLINRCLLPVSAR